MATVDRQASLLTAEEFAKRPDSGMAEELVRGVVVMPPPPGFRHGFVCARLAKLLAIHVDDNDLGRVLGNDAGVVTERGPDTVRGPDVSYYSYARVPKGREPVGYAATPPDLACEVISPSDRWKDVMEKVGEYLKAGVLAVVVLDPDKRTAHVVQVDRPPVALGPDDVLRLEPILPGFEVVVGQLFA
ncbi:Uma2 family endonuclease [Paludisphaera sp.]|uniref:Uma2 family endonuclease n=1 Tax=Paludisphaera sp. TaxID=2017432 RepID=UPI00301E5CC0